MARARGRCSAMQIGWQTSGRDFGGGLTEREVAWLVDQEFARSAEDILRRRSKLYLHMTKEEQGAFTDWFNTSHPDIPPA
jgi:glycerol-3-phosphate dehydrogenase